jgi:hypothetical protein
VLSGESRPRSADGEAAKGLSTAVRRCEFQVGDARHGTVIVHLMTQGQARVRPEEDRRTDRRSEHLSEIVNV